MTWAYTGTCLSVGDDATGVLLCVKVVAWRSEYAHVCIPRPANGNDPSHFRVCRLRFFLGGEYKTICMWPSERLADQLKYRSTRPRANMCTWYSDIESMRSLDKRTNTAMQQIESETNDAIPIIVAHGGVIRSILSQLTPPNPGAVELKMQNFAVLCVDTNSGTLIDASTQTTTEPGTNACTNDATLFNFLDGTSPPSDTVTIFDFLYGSATTHVDGPCTLANGKSGITKENCKTMFRVTVPKSRMLMEKGAMWLAGGTVDANCPNSYKLNAWAMEVVASFLMKAIRTTHIDTEFGVNAYSNKHTLDSVMTFEYTIKQPLSEKLKMYKQYNCGELITMLIDLSKVIDALWELCQFTHGDMKCDNVLCDGNLVYLNDFDKCSFTVRSPGYDSHEFIRLRPKKGRTSIPPLSKFIGYMARQGRDWATHNEQLEVRSARCPRENGGTFDKACLVASTLLQVNEDTFTEMIQQTASDSVWGAMLKLVDVTCINNKRRSGTSLTGNAAAAECLDNSVRHKSPIRLDSKVVWQNYDSMLNSTALLEKIDENSFSIEEKEPPRQGVSEDMVVEQPVLETPPRNTVPGWPAKFVIIRHAESVNNALSTKNVGTAMLHTLKRVSLKNGLLSSATDPSLLDSEANLYVEYGNCIMRQILELPADTVKFFVSPMVRTLETYISITQGDSITYKPTVIPLLQERRKTVSDDLTDSENATKLISQFSANNNHTAIQALEDVKDTAMYNGSESDTRECENASA